MLTSKKHKVLHDLSFAMLGASGIPQDVCHTFMTFSQMASVELTGLLSEMGPGLTNHMIVRHANPNQAEQDHLLVARFLGALAGNESVLKFRTLHSARRTIGTLLNRFRSFAIKAVPAALYGDAIWRVFFSKSLVAEDRAKALANSFAITDLNIDAVLSALRLPAFCAPRLDTDGYDFLVTPDARPTTVSRGTVKLMRFHDCIPILHPDTLGHVEPVVQKHQMTARAARDGYFVCNSVPTEHELVKLFPETSGRTTTIPCALSQSFGHDMQGIGLSEIARHRLSHASLAQGPPHPRGTSEILTSTPPKKGVRYLLGLSTLEPRKNFEGLILAWQAIKHRSAPDLKLVIVGRPGWRYEKILASIRPHLLSGELLHLQDASREELQALYREAACFVFPSFAEGFGFPPLEALQCGTPAVVSDIPTHRWVYGDSVLYCDPYNPKDIAEKIAQLVVHENRSAVRERLLSAASNTLKRYSMDQLSGQWEELFGRLKHGERIRSNV